MTRKRYAVRLTADAEHDLVDIHAYCAREASPDLADRLLDELEQACSKLSRLPHRGHVPAELERIGVVDFREIHHSRYRIIYEIVRSRVYVHCVLDGRRDLQSLLEQRLVR